MCAPADGSSGLDQVSVDGTRADPQWLPRERLPTPSVPGKEHPHHRSPVASQVADVRRGPTRRGAGARTGGRAPHVEPEGVDGTRRADGAIGLFGVRGHAATSLRAVTEAADANIAAVNYHFGSKEGLLRAVIGRAIGPVNTERERLLDQLVSRNGTPAAEDLVRAFAETGASLVSGGGKEGDDAEVARFLGRVMFEPEPAVRRIFADEVGPVEGRYLEALVDALPALPREEVVFRYRTMVGLLALHQTGALDDLSPHEGAADGGSPSSADGGASSGSGSGSADDDRTARLVSAVTAIFRTP
ncbi:TetR family transcriptional regulator [Streptomyces sp. NPDC004609]|uniref:TetR family transcriptional regulator n=1 Tax=Streptomyces sp. NPDC004609 TaxID=3364704 RepID=UPI0036C81168